VRRPSRALLYTRSENRSTAGSSAQCGLESRLKGRDRQNRACIARTAVVRRPVRIGDRHGCGTSLSAICESHLNPCRGPQAAPIASVVIQCDDGRSSRRHYDWHRPVGSDHLVAPVSYHERHQSQPVAQPDVGVAVEDTTRPRSIDKSQRERMLAGRLAYVRPESQDERGHRTTLWCRRRSSSERSRDAGAGDQRAEQAPGRGSHPLIMAQPSLIMAQPSLRGWLTDSASRASIVRSA